jgi:signal transduction histidine kinase
MMTATAAGTAPAPSPQLRRSHVDLLIAVGVGALELIGTHVAAAHQPDRRPWDLLGVTLLLAGPASLVVRRRYPRTVLAVTYATTLAYWVIGYPRGPIFLALIVAFFTVVLAGDRRAAIVSLVVGYATFEWLGPALGREPAPSLAAMLALPAWFAVLFASAELIRSRRDRAVDAAQLRASEADRQMSEERLRIARELHDVVAHNISLINVQAATTLHLLNGGDERASRALATIKQVSHETLGELRSVLGALRQVDDEVLLGPAHSLDQLDELVARTAAGGLAARLVREGSPRRLAAAVEQAGYRIVQEALTNVVRHTKATHATVRLVYGDHDLVVQIDDDGRGGTTVVPGNGITGMTERATALGGNLRAAPKPGGGFRVRAWIPLGDGS